MSARQGKRARKAPPRWEREPPEPLREWLGGRCLLTPPETGGEGVELVIWAQAPQREIVAHELVELGGGGGVLGRLLSDALVPGRSGPRKPDRLRVANAFLAAEVRAAIRDLVPVVVAPTPELDELVGLLTESWDEVAPVLAPPSYLDGGRLRPQQVAEAFRAARVLFAAAPWTMVDDGQVLRMDIPSLGVHGACVSILGNLGECLGLLIFPSLAAYEAFVETSATPRGASGLPDFGEGVLSLTYDHEDDLPDSLRDEVAAHGWLLAGPEAYPLIEHRRGDADLCPVEPRDLEIVTACAAGLAAFAARYPEHFTDDDEPVNAGFLIDEVREVYFTLPYAAGPPLGNRPVSDRAAAPARARSVPDGPVPSARAGAAPARALPDRPEGGRDAAPGDARPAAGRNDPCPCGSGRKYKKCCLARDEAQRQPGRAVHERDEEWAHELARYARRRFGAEALAFADDFEHVEDAYQLARPWSVYGCAVRGRPVVDWYLAERGERVPAPDRAWLQAQRAAWLSVWEVTAVEPGASLDLRDLLSGETRKVRELSGSRLLVVRDALLGRVVDHDGLALICGAHPRPLTPVDADEVVQRARRRLRRKTAVAPDRLRDEAFGRFLIRSWEEVVAESDARTAIRPQLENTDGERLVLTTDRFTIAPGKRPVVEAAIAAFPGVDHEEGEHDPAVYVFLRPGNAQHTSWENTVIGRARLTGDELALETNSRERADLLRGQVEAACGEHLGYCGRESLDPQSAGAGPGPQRAARPGSVPGPRPLAAPPPSPTDEQLVLAFKQRHYEAWVDEPLPALGGLTPRQAARTATGRAAVDLLLRDIENHEHRRGGSTPFDVASIRQRLRLD